MRAEWRKAPDFAEVAEALKVNTSQIVAAMALSEKHVMVIFTPDEDDHQNVFVVGTTRDDDGILRQASEPDEMPDFWEQMKNRIENQIKEDFGES